MPDNNSHITHITLAIITLISGWGVAIISNWAEIFQPEPDQNTIQIAESTPLPVQGTLPTPVESRESCQFGSCITPNGACGTIKLSLWCANPDESPHGCGTSIEKASSGKAYFSSKRTASRYKRVAARLSCVAS